MRDNNELLHLRIPIALSDIINKMSFDTGMSKQEVCRLMLYSFIEMRF